MLIDSDILIDVLNGQRLVVDRVQPVIESGVAAISAISVFELLVGVRGEQEATAARSLFASARLLDVSSEVAETAAAIDQLLRAAGLRIDAADCLIAGTALAHRLPLLTRNVRHFERIPGLEVVTV